jgi:hypothetical protein
MQFPCEMETLDDVTNPRGYETIRLPIINKRLPQQPVAWVRGVKKLLKKEADVTGIPLEHVEFQQPYVIATSEIPFNGANLRNTDWAGTKLNAVNSLNNQVESRLNFEGANLSGADFINAWLIHPVTKRHLGMRKAIQLCIHPEEHLNLLQKMQQATLIKHFVGIFGNSLETADTPVKTSVDQGEREEFIAKLKQHMPTAN